LFTNNEMRQLFGFAPAQGGERTVESLNFVDVNIKNDYQLNMSKAGKQPDKSKDENNPNDPNDPDGTGGVNLAKE